MSVVGFRQLRNADFCFGERVGDGFFPTFAEAWTTHDLDEVLAGNRAAFLKPMQHFCRSGDTIELFQVGELERPERDPLAMATLIVSGFETDRLGTHMRTQISRPMLRFGSSTGKGVEECRWRGKECVFQDGKRVGSHNTRIESVEHAERLRNPDPEGYSGPVKARLAELAAARPEAKALPPSHHSRQDDIAVAGFRKISRIIEVRTLDPIADLLADPQYFSRVTARFRTGDRVTFTRFASDTYSAVVELLHFALADVDGGRVRFYPQAEIVSTRHRPEEGWVVAPVEGRVHARFNGRTVTTFPSQEQCDWWLAERSITAKEAA